MIEKYEYIQGLTSINPMAKRLIIWIMINSDDNKLKFNYENITGVSHKSSKNFLSKSMQQLKKNKLIDYRFNGRILIVEVIDKKLI